MNFEIEVFCRQGILETYYFTIDSASSQSLGLQLNFGKAWKGH